MSIENKQLKRLLYPVKKVETATITPGYFFNNQQSNVVIVKTPKGDKVVNYCSPSYHLVPNQDIIEPILEALEGYDLDFISSSRNDSRFTLDVLIKGIDTEIGNKDKVIPRLRLYNSYDGRLKYQYHMGFFRLICSNGLIIPAKGFEDKNISMKLRHTPSLEKHVQKELVVDMVESFKSNLKLFTVPFNNLNQQKVGNVEERVRQVIEATKFPVRREEDVVERIMIEVAELKKPLLTDWMVYSGFNYNLNHNTEIKTDSFKKEAIDQQVLEFLMK